MINREQETAQTLIDRASRGALGRRTLLPLASALGVAHLIGPAVAAEAVKAGENQAANRQALKPSYDYVVVGGGAAGCIIAAQLAKAGAAVLVVEAGENDEAAGAKVDDPAIWFTNITGPLDWAYPTVPTPYLNGRSIPISAGRVLGGGTSINASLWVHGMAEDFDTWAYDGCTGWSFADVLPLYRDLENWTGGASHWRGVGGPMDVCLPTHPHPTAVAWLEASREMGVPVLDDMNAPMREGAAYTNMTIRPDGSRASASRAYLRPALGLPNLTLLTGTQVVSLVTDGARCTGVRLVADGQPVTVAAAREVILTAGGVGSAKLLMLSGIGPAADLRKLGIAPVADLPGVGQNYQDHPLLEGVIFRYKGVMPPRNPGSNAVEATSFIRSSPDRTGPDLQPVLIQLPVLTPALAKTYGVMPPDSFTIAPGLVRPSSRGTVKLASADHRANPLLDSGFLSTDADLAATLRCIEHCRELGRQKAFADITDGELVPGKAMTPAELADFARNSTTSYFHPVGTCKMGTDARAVVDPTLRVHGMQGLRVCDSSVMPNIVTGNTNAASQMIGLKAARTILASA